MNTTIEVTAEDIAYGHVEDESCCPIALAVRRITGRTDLFIGSDCIYKPCALVVCDLPESAQEFISRFDAGEPVEPFSFVISM